MAKVYSWEVSINPYAYAYIVHPNDTKRAYVGTELKGNNLQKVIDWVAECSDEDYIEHFNMVKELCEEKNYSVKFENVNAYMDVNTSCDNLRGPAGKGIINITLTNSTELADTYTINYTDGTNTSFVVRHGKQGEQGEQGKPGDKGVRTYFAMIYTSGRGEWDQILGTVDTPTGGEYDWTNNKLLAPTGWYESDTNENDISLKPPVWMSSRTFSETNTGDNGWSKPVMISGENGKPGVDGASLEFIYKRATTVSNAPTENENRPGFVPDGWENHPLGVDEDHRREWFTTRLYNKTEEKWGDWNTPAIWSQYGVNGQDGDGVEYIYYLASKPEALDNPTPSGYTSNAAYKEDEWTPSDMGGEYTNIDGDPISKDIAVNWKDNPTGVDGTNQWEWVAVRKYSGKDKKWGAFSDPSLWSKYGEDGQPGANATTIRKVYKMTNSTSDVPAPPTDNLYTDWNNAFPVDYTIEQCVWCCEAEIWANNNEFVQKYRKLSKSEITTEIENNAIGVGGTSVPTQKIGHEGDYIKMMYSGEYYVWDEGGWSKPYLVTGTKGVDATPMDYVTYVFYYGDRNNPPTGEPIGETGEGKTLEYIKTYGWIDFPDTKNGERVDNDTNCWYQCCLAMNSDNTIKSWGGIHPCNGKDGDALPGKYTEFRFKVTDNVNGKPNEPTLTDTDRTERTPEGWVATGEENFPTPGDNQTMWQIFAVINPNGNDGNGGVTDVVENDGWKGPIQVSAENGKDGKDGANGETGPAGNQGVSGIPGANFKVKYCLGTFSENVGERYWKNNEGKTYPWQIEGDEPYGNGYFGANVNNGIPKHDSDDWYDFIPNTEIVVCDGTKGDGISNYRKGTYLGRVIKRINNSGNICYLQIVLRVVYNPNVSPDKTYTERTTWTRAEYDAYNDAEKLYSYYENGKVWCYKHRQVSIDALENEGEDVVENFHVYIWCVQGTETWKKGTETDDKGNLIDKNIYEGIKWGIPFKLQGTNGLNGLKGADGRSQTVYPMGVYDSNEVYLTTESKAPYVYDPNDSNFYVLNRVDQPWVGKLPDGYESVIIHPSTANSENTDKNEYTKEKLPPKNFDFIKVTNHEQQITDTTAGTIDYTSATFYYQWSNTEGKYVPASYYKYAYDYGYGSSWIVVDQDGTTPCQNYQNSITNKHEPAWVKFESFEALYTSIGIIENGMIGSAVYNNEFMFSQQGIDESGNITNYASESAENGGGFLSGYEYDREGVVDESGVTKHWKYKGTETYISDNDVNPYEMKMKLNSATPVHSFRPNITLNFKTGQAYLSTGEITFGNGVMTAHTGIFNNVIVNGTVNKQIIEINNYDDFNKYFCLGSNGGYYLSLTTTPDIIMINYWGDNYKNVINLPYYCPRLIDGDTPYIQYEVDYGYKKENGNNVLCKINDLRSLIGREIILTNNTSGELYISCGPAYTFNLSEDSEDIIDNTFNGIKSITPTNDWEVRKKIGVDPVSEWETVINTYYDNSDKRQYYLTPLRANTTFSLKCDIAKTNYINSNLISDGIYSLIGWRINCFYPLNGKINNVHKTYDVVIYDNNIKIFSTKIAKEWNWRDLLLENFDGKEDFKIEEDTGFIKYKNKYLIHIKTEYSPYANTMIIQDGYNDYNLSDNPND